MRVVFVGGEREHWQLALKGGARKRFAAACGIGVAH
jgi:hypothetical protein